MFAAATASGVPEEQLSLLQAGGSTAAVSVVEDILSEVTSAAAEVVADEDNAALLSTLSTIEEQPELGYQVIYYRHCIEVLLFTVMQ